MIDSWCDNHNVIITVIVYCGHVSMHSLCEVKTFKFLGICLLYRRMLPTIQYVHLNSNDFSLIMLIVDVQNMNR